MNGLADAVIEYVNGINDSNIELTKNFYKSNFILILAVLQKLFDKKILTEHECDEIAKTAANTINDEKYMKEIFKGFEEIFEEEK